jgi:hypothetical protein
MVNFPSYENHFKFYSYSLRNIQIKDDGHVDVDKLEETFLAKADSSWKPVASAAVDKCKEEMASIIIKEDPVERLFKLVELFSI